MADDLDVLAPAAREVTAQGEAIRLSPFYFGQFPKVMGLLRQISEQIRGVNVMRFVTEGTQVRFELASDWPALLPQVLELAGEPWIALLGVAANKPRAWFDTLPADEGLALSNALVKVNADFFARKVLPMVQTMMGAPEALPDGAASSPGSSPAVTAETTSTA
jgi:hypothetical protein